MMTATPTFGQWLKGELQARGWGIWTLARRIDRDNPEVPRRAINRYVHDGTNPSDKYIALIAEALNLEREEVARRAAPFSRRRSV